MRGSLRRLQQGSELDNTRMKSEKMDWKTARGSPIVGSVLLADYHQVKLVNIHTLYSSGA
jgi:hypothetical protein